MEESKKTETKNAIFEKSLTLLYKKSKNNSGYYGFIKEMPAAFSQGEDVAKLGENVLDAMITLLYAYTLEHNKKRIDGSEDTDINSFGICVVKT
jgi:predicted RNase H-like HicB family nuclease